MRAGRGLPGERHQAALAASVGLFRGSRMSVQTRPGSAPPSPPETWYGRGGENGGHRIPPILLVFLCALVLSDVGLVYWLTLMLEIAAVAVTFSVLGAAVTFGLNRHRLDRDGSRASIHVLLASLGAGLAGEVIQLAAGSGGSGPAGPGSYVVRLIGIGGSVGLCAGALALLIWHTWATLRMMKRWRSP